MSNRSLATVTDQNRDARTIYRLVPSDARRDSAMGGEDGWMNARTFELDGTFAGVGVWAAVEPLVEHVFSDLLGSGPAGMIEEHLYELHMVLPKRRDCLRPRLCLTDTSPPAEQTRLYPVNRAYRIVHGLVGFILQWTRTGEQQGPWRLAVRNFDKAQHLGTRFFAELARRAAPDGQLQVFVESSDEPDAGALSALGVAAVPATCGDAGGYSLRLPPHRDEEPELSLTESRLADASRLDIETQCPRLVAWYQSEGNRLAAARHALTLLSTYNRCGYFNEGKQYIDVILESFEELAEDDERSRLRCAKEIYACLISCGEADRALSLFLDLALPYLHSPASLADADYLLGVHFVRHATKRDVELGQLHLLRAVETIRLAGDSFDPQKHIFKKVFTDNALALLRSRQGRHDEAIGLCQAGYAELTQALGEDRYLLHRSVLQYNTAQACMVAKRPEDALIYYANAIAMDPDYSEYHNEVGNILQRQEKFAESLECYEVAIRCSPPYPEVYFNKALCHVRQGELESALACLAITLELSPDQLDAYVIRGEVLGELERFEEALASYDRAILLDGDTIAVRVNRAVMHFRTGAYALALAEMDLVIARDPDDSEHYDRRAAICEAMSEPTATEPERVPIAETAFA